MHGLTQLNINALSFIIIRKNSKICTGCLKKKGSVILARYCAAIFLNKWAKMFSYYKIAEF